MSGMFYGGGLALILATIGHSEGRLHDYILSFCQVQGLAPVECANAAVEAAGSVHNWAYNDMFDLEVGIATTVDGRSTSFAAGFHNASIGAGTVWVRSPHQNNEWVLLPTSHPINLTDPVVIHDLTLMQKGARAFCQNLYYTETEISGGNAQCESLLLQQVGLQLRERISRAREAALVAARLHWGGSFSQNSVQLQHTVGGFR
jgi:hypothetical protein